MKVTRNNFWKEHCFWIAQEVLNKKEGADASHLFRMGKKVTGTKPKVIITDGLHSYSEAYRKEFWTEIRILYVWHSLYCCHISSRQ